MKGVSRPRDFMVLTCATRILDAATIFMALVILAMFCTERMRCLTAQAHRLQVRAPPEY